MPSFDDPGPRPVEGLHDNALTSDVDVELHPVGPLRIGLWADCCNLPSLLEQDFVLVWSETLRNGARMTYRVCADCGARP